MDINDFAELWQEENDLFRFGQSGEFWNSKANIFNHCINGSFDTKKDELLCFLQERNIVNAETKILDIGCGPGRYSSEFAKRAKQVTGIDISPKMIQYAKQNTDSKYLNRVSYKTAAWEAVDLDYWGWRKEYDLVFASFCPGISGRDALLKTCEASKGYCFMSGFMMKKDEIGDRLYRSMYGEEPPRRGKNLYYALNILFLSGYYPEIIYHDNDSEQVLTTEQAVAAYCDQLRQTKQVSDDMSKRVANYFESIARKGVISGNLQTKLAWIFWKV